MYSPVVPMRTAVGRMSRLRWRYGRIPNVTTVLAGRTKEQQLHEGSSCSMHIPWDQRLLLAHDRGRQACSGRAHAAARLQQTSPQARLLQRINSVSQPIATSLLHTAARRNGSKSCSLPRPLGWRDAAALFQDLQGRQCSLPGAQRQCGSLGRAAAAAALAKLHFPTP